jgi:hypothetical protein
MFPWDRVRIINRPNQLYPTSLATRILDRMGTFIYQPLRRGSRAPGHLHQARTKNDIFHSSITHNFYIISLFFVVNIYKGLLRLYFLHITFLILLKSNGVGTVQTEKLRFLNEYLFLLIFY